MKRHHHAKSILSDTRDLKPEDSIGILWFVVFCMICIASFILGGLFALLF